MMNKNPLKKSCVECEPLTYVYGMLIYIKSLTHMM